MSTPLVQIKMKHPRRLRRKKKKPLVTYPSSEDYFIEPEIDAYEKPKKNKVPYFLMTREIGKRHLPREKYLKLCFIEMLVYLVFLVTLGLVATFQRTGNEYYLTRVMTKLFVERKFKVVDTNEVLSFNDINEVEQIWDYIMNLFLVWSDWSFYYSFIDKEASSNLGEMVFFQNRYVGAVRLRQVRVKQKTCEVPGIMQKVVGTHCYSAYSSSTEGKDNFGSEQYPKVGTKVQGDDVPIQPTAENASTPNITTTTPRGFPHELDPEVPDDGPYSNESVPEDSGKLKPDDIKKLKLAWEYSGKKKPILTSLPTTGEISTYGGQGFYKDFTENDAVARNDSLKSHLFNHTWIDQLTRAVIIQFTTYSRNENLFFTMKLLFELPSTGGVVPSHFVYSEKLISHGFVDFLILILFGVFALFVVFYTISEIIEIYYFKLHYFDYFWNVWDLIILIYCYLLIGLFAYSMFINLEVEGLIKTVSKNQGHICFDKYNYARENFITFLSVTFFFAAVKLLKYMNFNHPMFQMQLTLSKASKDIVCFSLMFFIVFITFAQFGHLLFGAQVRDFRSFIHSIFALLRTTVGDFDYHKIENVDHFLGPVYFFAYIFFIYFILVNMFLAIIIDTYSEVRASIREKGQEPQMFEVIFKWFKCFGKKEKKAEQQASAPRSPHTDIQNLLARCGFTDMEINLFFAKFDIPKDQKVPKEEMRQKLLINFNMEPQAEALKAQEAKEKDEIGERLMDRIVLLENNIKDVNSKIDLIDTKIDHIQQTRARKHGQLEEQK